MIIIYSIFLIGCIIALIYIILQKKKNKLNHTKNSEEAISIDKKMSELLATTRYDTENRCYICKDGILMDLVQIKSKDLVNANPDEVQYDDMKFVKFYKIYEQDIKYISLNFPSNTREQQQYINNKIMKCKNPIILKALKRKKNELVWIEKNKAVREFYIMYYAYSKEELYNLRSEMESSLSVGKEGLLEYISDEKKHKIMWKLNNKNALIM